MAIILLSGNESFLKKEALDKFKREKLSGPNRELNYDIFYGEDARKDISGALNSLSFFNEDRLVVIKNVDRLSAPEKEVLLKYLKKPSPKIFLVLETRQSDLAGSFLSQVARLAKIITCNKLPIAKLYNWIYNRAHLYKKKIAKDASDLLLELVGDDLGGLATELEKLALYAGAKPQIAKTDVENIVGRDITRDIFQLVNAIDKKDSEQSLKLVSMFAGNKRKESEVIGLLGWHLRRLLKAKQMQEKGVSRFDIGKAIRIPSRYREKFFDQLSSFDIKNIRNNIELLIKADQDLKTGKGKTGLTLELVMVRLTSA